MLPERNSQDDKNLQRFRKDLERILNNRSGPISAVFLDGLRTRWCVWGQDTDSILSNLGWKQSTIDEVRMLIPVPPPESKVKIEPRAPQRVTVDRLPWVHRPGPKPDSDGEIPGTDDGRHPADED